MLMQQDGQLVILQADPLVEINDQVLVNFNPEWFSYGDNIFSVHAANGDVSYGLRDHDDIRETWLGVRSDMLDDVPRAREEGLA